MDDQNAIHFQRFSRTPADAAQPVADVTPAAFSVFNSLRFFAYVPQIAKAMKDRSGAEAISFGTWSLFLASHASAMAYAIENLGDWTMASLFLANVVGCAAILVIALWKRSRHRRRWINQAVQLDDPSRTGPLPRADLGAAKTGRGCTQQRP